MSEASTADATVTADTKPRAMRFRPRSTIPLLARDSVRRQGAITALAFQLLGKDRAIAFLNTDHATLGGRPLALATDSLAGQQAVERELHRLAERP